jgi:hypothetical protein
MRTAKLGLCSVALILFGVIMTASTAAAQAFLGERRVDVTAPRAAAKQHHDSATTPANYKLELLGERQTGPYSCLLVPAMPKRPDKYLFEGAVRVDAQDFAVVRIGGQPEQKLSFWIERVTFVREYQKIDGFWLSTKDETFVEIRMYGEKTLATGRQNYSMAAAGNTDELVRSAGD